MNPIRNLLAAIVLLLPLSAAAYIGPGSGISLLGGIWSVLVGIVLALAAILFWPIRLMVKRMRARKKAEGGSSDDASPSAPADSE